ncbi:MAG: 50S ribosomal protein L30 [Candidatus Helarchaeota archaeon]
MAAQKAMDRTERLAIIRIRGNVGVRRSIRDTLQMFRLFRVNHAVIIDNRKSYMGMLKKTKDYITWGKINRESLIELLRKRGKLIGNVDLTDEYVQKFTRFKSIEEFADALMNFEVELKDLPHLKPVFRLRPPKNGFKKKKKRPYHDKGELGNRDEEINELLMRMV